MVTEPGRVDPFAVAGSQLSLSVIIPVFNEAHTVQLALDGLVKALDGQSMIRTLQIIVVESNSTDGSRELVLPYAADPRFELVLQDKPRGKGFAVREGLERVQGDVALIFDADCEYDPCDIPRLLEPLNRGETSFVLGSRHTGSAMRKFDEAPLTASVMNVAHRVFAGMLNVVYGTRLRDPFTMYKVFRVSALHGVPLTADRFDFDWELVGKLVRVGCKPIEIPVSYTSRDFGQGKKVRLFRDPLSWMVALFRYRFCSLSGSSSNTSAHSN